VSADCHYVTSSISVLYVSAVSKLDHLDDWPVPEPISHGCYRLIIK